MDTSPDPQLDAQAHNLLPGEPMLTRTPVTLTFGDGFTQQGWLYYATEGIVFLTRFSLFPGGPPTETLAEKRTYRELGRAQMTSKRFGQSARIAFASGVQIDGQKAHISNLASLSAIVVNG